MWQCAHGICTIIYLKTKHVSYKVGIKAQPPALRLVSPKLKVRIRLVCTCKELAWSIVILLNQFAVLLSPSGKGDLHLSSPTVRELLTPADCRDECQGSHQQGGVQTPRWEDAGCCAGEEEDQEEDPIPGHWWAGGLHDLHLCLRSEVK